MQTLSACQRLVAFESYKEWKVSDEWKRLTLQFHLKRKPVLIGKVTQVIGGRVQQQQGVRAQTFSGAKQSPVSPVTLANDREH